MNDASFYLKIIDNFVVCGDIPSTEDNDNIPKWNKQSDPLLDYLMKLMQDPDTCMKVLGSKLCGRVFYTTVGRFIIDCLHNYDFHRQCQWTERKSTEDVLSLSDGKKEHWQALLEQVDANHSDDGFQKDFFQKLFSQECGWKKQENWNKLVHDWRGCMDKKLINQLGERIKGKSGAEKQTLDLAIRQLQSHMKAHCISESKALQAWDMMEGQWTETEFEKRLKTVKIQDKYPEIEEVAKKMGRIADNNGRDHLATTKGNIMKLSHSSGSDIEGITIGNNINAVLPTEWAEYDDDQMSDLFMYKFLGKRLQTFMYKSQITKPSRKLGFTHASRKGPMIICIDTSASMYGTAQTIEQSLLSKVCQVAEDLQRPCFLIDFSVSVRPVNLLEKKREQRMKQLNINNSQDDDKDLIPFINGGTSAEKMITTMFELLDNEGNRFVNADVLWITDFLIPMADNKMLTKMTEYRRTGTKFYGMQITGEEKSDTTWEQYFDKIYHIYYRQIRRY